eukprot:354901-Chlamydomonas_euryale.AAC.8
MAAHSSTWQHTVALVHFSRRDTWSAQSRRQLQRPHVPLCVRACACACACARARRLKVKAPVEEPVLKSQGWGVAMGDERTHRCDMHLQLATSNAHVHARAWIPLHVKIHMQMQRACKFKREYTCACTVTYQSVVSTVCFTALCAVCCGMTWHDVTGCDMP